MPRLAFVGTHGDVMKQSFYPNNWSVVVPVANEEAELPALVASLKTIMNLMSGGKVYFVVDKVSKDRTLESCRAAQQEDNRFVTCWMPENRNVMDAYLGGFKAALAGGHEIIIEMDAGLSHDPRAIPVFLRALNEGNDCAFGSRYINGGSMVDSPLSRRFLSKGGSILARLLLGVKMADLTSGYQAFHRCILEDLIGYPLRSKAHFYQTEVRYLLRHHKWIEVPIHYRAPSPRVSQGAIGNSIAVLLGYTVDRFIGKPRRV